jgi:hypothetical protein
LLKSSLGETLGVIDRKSDFATGESHQDIQIPETPAEPFLLQGDDKEDEYWLRGSREARGSARLPTGAWGGTARPTEQGHGRRTRPH